MHSVKDVVKRYPSISGIVEINNDYDESPGDGAIETDTTTFVCLLDGQPFEIQYRWYRDYRKPHPGSSGEVCRKPITMETYRVVIGGQTTLDLTSVKKELKRADEIATELKRITPECPKCRAAMVLQLNRHDKSRFWGCPNFKKRGCTGKSSASHRYYLQLEQELSSLK